jgi:hypothetical protein
LDWLAEFYTHPEGLQAAAEVIGIDKVVEVPLEPCV